MQLTRVVDTLHGGAVLVQSGLVSPGRPALALRSLVLTRKLGAVAGQATLSALRNPEDVAIIDDSGSVTYGDLNRRSNALARGLAHVGVDAGSTVGLLCRDHSDAVAVMIAIAKRGARLVLLNTGFAGPQLRDVALREGLAAIVVDEEFGQLLEAVPEVSGRFLAELGNRATARFGDVIHNLYGCTEVALATVAMPDDWKAAPGTVGRPPHGIKVALYDADDHLVTTPGEIGTIFVDNGLKFDGYSGGGNKRTIGRYMSTGDRGHWDSAGRLFVDGRDDDMIVSGGENVFPREIEDLVASLDGVDDVATLPVGDPDFGTRLRMFVVADGTRPVDEEMVKSHVRANLARYKVPREVWLVDQIPYTPTGKIDRRRLAEIDAPKPASS